MEVLGGAIFIIFICLTLLIILGFLYFCEFKKSEKVKKYRSCLTCEQLKLIDDYEQNTKLTLSDFKRNKK